MADLTDDQLVALRRYVGKGFTDPELQDAFDRQGNLRDAAVEILETVYADMIINPLSFTIIGEYAQNANKNPDLLRKFIDNLRIQDKDLTLSLTNGGTVIIKNTRMHRR